MSNMSAIVWECWRKNGVSLQQGPIEVAKALGIRVYSYIEGKALLDELNLPKDVMKRAAFTARHNGKPCIFYAAGLPVYLKNHVIFHEIGHCVSGHENIGFVLFGETDNKELREQQEVEAEEYALEAIPSPVLKEAGITSRKDIQRVTRLDDLAVANISKRIANYEYQKLDPEEEDICKYYRDFIRVYKRASTKQQNLRKIILLGAVTAISIALVVSTAIITTVVLNNNTPAAAPPSDYISSRIPTTTSEEEIILPPATNETLPPKTTEATPETEPAAITDQPTTTQNNEQIVYWLDGGDVYHVKRNCQHIRTKKDSLVRSGTIEESGKSRACKTCG